MCSDDFLCVADEEDVVCAGDLCVEMEIAKEKVSVTIDESSCVLCSSDISGDALQTLTDIGRPAFISNCIIAGRHDLAEIVESGSLGMIKVHRRCRNQLTSCDLKV